jgi:hypothetical protein
LLYLKPAKIAVLVLVLRTLFFENKCA